jgi:hypothetical protein
MQVLQQLDFGDVEGHPFHGNQWTDYAGNLDAGKAWAQGHLNDPGTKPYKPGDPVQEYFSFGYRLVNDHLTGKQRADYPDEVKAQVRAIEREMKPTSSAVQVYRGAPAVRLREGQIISNKAFTSTSLDPNVARAHAAQRDEGAVVSTIEVPAGVNAMFHTSEPAWGPQNGFKSENELLLQRNLKFEVIDPNPEAPRLRVVQAGSKKLEFGDAPGHPFHGNQWTQAQTDQLKKDLGRQIWAYKNGKSRWNDIWSVADTASQHPDPEVAAIGKQLKEAVWPTKKKAEFGDTEGHPFHGNQWTDRGGSAQAAHDKNFVEVPQAGGKYNRTMFVGGPEAAKALLTGGLTAADFPYGQMPGLVDKYGKYIDDQYKSPWTDEVKPADTPISLPRGQLEWTPAEQAQARENLAAVVQNNDPTTRVPMSAFKEILNSGEVQNQWETGRSGAATGASREYEPRRGNAETDTLGISPDAQPAERPVYGYLAPSGHADILSPERDEDRAVAEKQVFSLYGQEGAQARFDEVKADPDAYVYVVAPSRYNGGEGDFIVGPKLKSDLIDEYQRRSDEVAEMSPYDRSYKDRVGMLNEMSDGDRYYPLGDGHGNLNDQTVFGLANKEHAANSYGDVQITYNRDVLDKSTITGGDSIDMHLMAAPAKMIADADPRVPIGMVAGRTSFDNTHGQYVEMQMHEHPQLDDMKHVAFTGGKPTKAMQDTLAEHGVTWSHEPVLKPKKVSWEEAIR